MFFMDWRDRNRDFLRKHEIISNHFRSWYIMERYFGVVREWGGVELKIELPEELKNWIRKINIEAEIRWEERAKLN